MGARGDNRLVRAYSFDRFAIPLPPGHRFPVSKSARLRERVLQACPEVQVVEAPAASDGELALVHTPAYVHDASHGLLSALAQRAIGLPWSPAMVERARRSVGACADNDRVISMNAGAESPPIAPTRPAQKSATCASLGLSRS